jgi:[ribosomal protein S5]-alanine N-acetyltransferase
MLDRSRAARGDGVGCGMCAGDEGPLVVPSVSPVVECGRVRLRAVSGLDAAALLKVSFYDGVAARDEAHAREQLARIAGDQARGESVHWGIEDIASGALVGTVGYYRGFEQREGEVGYVLLLPWRGKGLMREALRCALAFGLDELGLRCVRARTAVTNAASIAVLARCGFRLERSSEWELTYVARRPDCPRAGPPSTTDG